MVQGMGNSQSSVGITTGYGLDSRDFDSRGVHDYSLLHSAQTGSVAHLTAYPKGSGGDPPRGMAVGA
jgi:hypothetical protein